MACSKLAVPLNELPYIVLADSNCVVVLALPAKLPVTFPTTLPVTLPVKAAVTVPALKLPLGSLLTKVLTVFVAVAALIVVLIEPMVEELTPPILLDEVVILELTKDAVATSVPLAASAGVVAVGVPVKEGDEIVGDTIVLFVKVSVPARVAKVPLNGNVTLVAPIEVRLVLKFPAVVKLPPNEIVFDPLSTPVPPLALGNTPVTCEVKLIVPDKSAVLNVVQAGAEPPVDFNT